MTAILQTQGLSRTFNGFHAVSDVNLSVQEGSIHALIGPNGAGKTTCFNLLTRFIDASAGSIRFQGQDITRMPADAVARLGLVRSFQISAVFGQLSVFENVRLAVQRRRGHSMDWWRSDRALAAYDERTSEVLAEGNYAEVSRDPRVVEAYLGHGHAGQRKHNSSAGVQHA